MKNFPKKGLGQNWLISEDVVEQMISALNIGPRDYVVEIGAGLGALTIHLIKKVKKVTAVEIDKDLLALLEANLREIKPKLNNVEIVNRDILDFPIPKINYKIIGSLPYYITSPIINRFLFVTLWRDKQKLFIPNPPTLAVFLVQKEVAQKICACPGDMNVLALNVQTFAKPEIIAHVPRSAFRPQPEVDSAIIRITPYEKPTVSCDLKRYFSLISRAFSGKRKKLSNTLKELRPQLEKLGLANLRPQELSLQDWEKLTQKSLPSFF